MRKYDSGGQERAAILREVRALRLLRNDPFWSRELSNRCSSGMQSTYFRRDGISLDAMLQHLQGCRLVARSMTVTELIDWLDTAFHVKVHDRREVTEDDYFQRQLCTRCAELPRRGGKQRWCKECRNAEQRENRLPYARLSDQEKCKQRGYARARMARRRARMTGR